MSQSFEEVLWGWCWIGNRFEMVGLVKMVEELLCPHLKHLEKTIVWLDGHRGHM